MKITRPLGAFLLTFVIPSALAIQLPPLAGFADGIHHYQNKNGKDYPRLSEDDIDGISENILLYQKNVGGWIENQDPLRILSEEEKNKFLAMKNDIRVSFDNRNTYTQIEWLGYAWKKKGDKRYSDAALLGIKYILNQQYAICAGWPHTIPPKPSTEKEDTRYQRAITNADDVTSGILRTFRKILDDRDTWSFVDADTLSLIKDSVTRGDKCLLRLQIVQNGNKTGWAGQYDPESLKPVGGRSYELPGIISQETVGVLEYLTSIENPSQDMIDSIQSASKWLNDSAFTGFRLVKFEAPAEKYAWHSSNWDRKIVKDPDAPRIWARFYDLNDNSVIFANRDGKRVAHYEDIARERRTGYGWYGYFAEKYLTKTWPEWMKKNNVTK
jgi:PelA/Pel-15E family pectate lyase